MVALIMRRICSEAKALLHKLGSERGIAVQHGNTNLQLGDLAVEASGHEGLAEQLDAVPLSLDTASAMVATPPSPYGSAQVLRSA
ncbi:hypothetical protein BZA02_10539 [Ruegeria sp. P4]|nr:hypothetical protein BZA02_10539 [Ruegeria sp. P4]